MYIGMETLSGHPGHFAGSASAGEQTIKTMLGIKDARILVS